MKYLAALSLCIASTTTHAAYLWLADTLLTYDEGTFQSVTTDANSYTLMVSVAESPKNFSFTLWSYAPTLFSHNVIDFSYALTPFSSGAIYFSEASTKVAVVSGGWPIFESFRYRKELDASLIESKWLDLPWQAMRFDFSEVSYKYQYGPFSGATLTIKLGDIAPAIPEPGAFTLLLAGLLTTVGWKRRLSGKKA